MSNYFNTLGKIIDNKYSGTLYLYEFNYWYNGIQIKINYYGKINKEEYLQFIKDIFKFKQHNITLDSAGKFDISFKVEKDSLDYLDKLEIFQ